LDIAKQTSQMSNISKELIEIVISEMKEHNNIISINLTEEDFLNQDLLKYIIDNLDQN